MSPVLAAILGGVTGFLLAIIPELYFLWHERKKQEQMPAAQGQGAEQASDGSDRGTPEQSSAEYVAPATQAEYPITYVLLDILRTSVRPVLTYAFFFLFALIRLIAMWHAYHIEHAKTIDLLPILWDEGTGALFATVLGFWFGTRAIFRARRGI